ncbi:MAG: histidinol dehydrogenase [Caldilineaceae bacterium]
MALWLWQRKRSSRSICWSPCNAYVAEAKRQLFGRAGIDLVGRTDGNFGHHDESADAEMVATDLLGQAEHGPTSPAILLTTSTRLANEIEHEIGRQLEILPTADVVGTGVSRADHSAESDAEMVHVADQIAQKHVEVLTKNPRYFLDRSFG